MVAPSPTPEMGLWEDDGMENMSLHSNKSPEVSALWKSKQEHSFLLRSLFVLMTDYCFPPFLLSSLTKSCIRASEASMCDCTR